MAQDPSNNGIDNGNPKNSNDTEVESKLPEDHAHAQTQDSTLLTDFNSKIISNYTSRFLIDIKSLSTIFDNTDDVASILSSTHGEDYVTYDNKKGQILLSSYEFDYDFVLKSFSLKQKSDMIINGS